KMSCGQLGINCEGHSKGVVEMGFSKVCESGYYLASAGLDKLVVLRHGDTGDWVGTLTGHEAGVWSVCLNDDATLVASGSGDQTARIWCAVTGDELEKFLLPEGVSCVDLNDKSTLLVTGCLGEDPIVTLFDLNGAGGIPLMTLSGHSRGVRNAIFCRNSFSILTSSYDRTVRMWDYVSGMETHSIVVPHHAKSLELNADNNIVTIAYGNSVIFLDTRNFKVLSQRKLDFKVSGASLHPNKESYICILADGRLNKYDYVTDNLLDSFFAHKGDPICCVGYSPDGEVYASASCSGEMMLWQQNVGKKYGLW
ncbi:hypothetical protein KR026_005187, partial [Drosophila bipectinata]